MKRLIGVGLLAAMLGVGMSCGDGTGPAGPGSLVVRLTSPHSGADSAIVLTITGPQPLTSAIAGSGLRLFQPPLSATTTKFALVGQLNTNAVILTIGIQDLTQWRQYSSTINGIAQPNYQLRPLTGYALALTR